MLYQFQCQKEGTLFYYQTTGSRQTARAVVHRCPVCGSKRTDTTGREYPEVDESAPLHKAAS